MNVLALLVTLVATVSSTSAFLTSVAGPSSPSFITTLKMAGGDAAEVKVGDKLPDVTLMEGQADYGKPDAVKLLDLVAGKKVAIFAVPGAFTPGCSKSHLPSFIDAKDQLASKGVDMIICVATNDAFVMEAWGRTSGGADAGIKFLSDSDAALTRGLGLAMDSDVFVRSKRYSLIAEDGVVTHYFSSAKEASDTWAPNVLSAL